ncbi:hypothetical protein [Aureispira sp. CCB-QB1]|uniref:hypothetical protein n=1 Tax=Aureispira sp. CCB-QB1 TaxID=1313421 RepID=UPI0006985CAE|nr:hypothetical protein [Aureispira sp. CCB-QB1]
MAKLLKLTKGKQIQLEGNNYQIARSININVIKPKEAPSKQEAVKGNHQTDVQPDRTKHIACAIIQKKIKQLEQEENNALCSIDEDDVLFLFDKGETTPKTSFSKQVERTTEIVDLKEILKQIQAI